MCIKVGDYTRSEARHVGSVGQEEGVWAQLETKMVAVAQLEGGRRHRHHSRSPIVVELNEKVSLQPSRTTD